MWHPNDGHEAASDMAAFIEWLRATSGKNGVNPAFLREWQAAEPEAFAIMLSKFYRETDENFVAHQKRATKLFSDWDAIRRPASHPDAQ